MKLNFIPILLLSVLFSVWSTGVKAQCTEPGSYDYETISDGLWSDATTWLGGSIPNSTKFNKNRSILISHNVVNAVAVATLDNGATLVINGGGSLTVNSFDLSAADALHINFGSLITTTGSFRVRNTSDFCAYNACIDIKTTIQLEANLTIQNSGLKAGTNITNSRTVTGSNIKLYAGTTIVNSGTWAASTVIAYYAGTGTLSGFSGTPVTESSNTLDVCKPSSDLKVLKTVDFSSTPVGSSVIFTITASNINGQNEPNAKVQDLLPAGFTYVSHTVSAGTYNNLTGLWTIGALNVGNYQTMTLTALFNSAASNTATISGDNLELSAANNTASAAVAVGACVVPSISTQAIAFQVAAISGIPTNLSVGVSGTGPFTYKWYKNVSNSNVGGTLIVGATSSSYTPPTNVVGILHYYVEVSGFCLPTVKSTVSKVTVVETLCVTGCNDNAFINAVDRNTIEYDDVVGLYHSTMMKRADQKIFVWGENSNPNGSSPALSPKEVSAANGYAYTGSILKFTGAEYGQFAVLTTTGLYIWGKINVLISSGIKNTTAFGAVTIGGQTNGLPIGVSPSDVKMMFGSVSTLAITTCNGDAWVLSKLGTKYGDGATVNATNDNLWHRVKKSAGASDFLTNVIAMRGTPNAMMALTSDGKVYTWGSNTYLGDGSAVANRVYATEMDIPAGIDVKMIGMTPSVLVNSYYILGTTGKLYSLGNNTSRQLGDFSTTERLVWVGVHKPTAVLAGATDSGSLMEDIAWISPQEHDNRYGAFNALSLSGILYAWGENNFNMLGTAIATMNPTYMPGGLTATDKILAVETGGHVSLTFRRCSKKYGYVGHRINGSMGDGTSNSATETSYNFSQTADFNLCGAPTAPTVQNLNICPATTANLADAELSNPFVGTTVEWYTTSNMAPGTKVLDPTSVGPGTYYAFYVGDCPSPSSSDPVVVIEYVPADPQYLACFCFEPKVTDLNTYSSLQGITSLSRTGSQYYTWLTSSQSAWTVLEAKTKGFVLNRVKFNASNKPVAADGVTLVITSPIEGMMVYDITNNCLKLYTSKDNGVTLDWYCLTKQGCPQ